MNITYSPNLTRHFKSPTSKADIILDQINKGMYEKYMPLVKDKEVLDIGANIGLFSLWASEYAKKVYSVEPTISHYNLLLELIKENKLNNVSPINEALFKTLTTVEFYLNIGNSTMNSVIPYGDNTSQAYSVKTNTLGNLLNTYPNVSFLKMDIEGSESLLLDNDEFFQALSKLEGFFIEVHSIKIVGDLEELSTIRDSWIARINATSNNRFKISKEGTDGIAGYAN